MTTSREVRGIGVSVPRFDAPEKVTGRTQYVADVQVPGMLHARLLRSPHAHARIKRIDVSPPSPTRRAGAVLTAADVPELKSGAKTRAHALLAIDRVVFAGQPVAAVAADELSIARGAGSDRPSSTSRCPLPPTPSNPCSRPLRASRTWGRRPTPARPRRTPASPSRAPKPRRARRTSPRRAV